MPPLQAILSLIGIIIVIIAAYYATKYIGLKASGQNRSKYRRRNRNIILRDRFAISKDKSFCIVEIAGKAYVIGVTNQSMTLLDTLDATVFEKNEAKTSETAAWNTMPGSSFSGKLVNRVAAFIAQKMGKPQDIGGATVVSNRSFSDSMKSAHERDISGRQNSPEDI